MTFEELTEKIRRKVGTSEPLNATLKLTLDGDQHIHIDGNQQPGVVTNDDAPADCTIRTSLETIQKILSGESNAMNAFMMGKIKVDGNIGVAMNLTKVL